MLVSLLCVAVLAMLLFPKTPVARWLRSTLVERPLAWAANVKRRDILFLLVAGVLLLSGAEFVALFGAAELLALGAQLSLYFDAVLVSTAVSIAAGAATAWRSLRRRLPLNIGRPAGLRRRAASRAHGARKLRPRRESEETEPAWALHAPAAC